MKMAKNTLLSLLLAIALLLPSVAAALPARAAEEREYIPYVSEGLVLHLDGFGNGADVKYGTWDSEVGRSVALLGAPKLWRRQEGGVGYAVRSYEEWLAHKGEAALLIGAELLPRENFTLEFTFAPHGIVDAAGERVYHTKEMNGSDYGLFNGDAAAFSFGALHFVQFMPSLSEMGNSLRVRAIYGEEGNYYKVGYNGTLGDYEVYKEWDVPEEWCLTYETAPGGAGDPYPLARYRLVREETEVFSLDNQTTQKAAGKTFVENAKGGLRLFGDLPATVYSVRIYDGILTGAERRQNHLAELSRMADITVRDFDAFTPEEKEVLLSLADSVALKNAKEECGRLRDAIAFFEGGRDASGLSLLGFRAHTEERRIRAEFFLDGFSLSLWEMAYDAECGILAKSPTHALSAVAYTTEGGAAAFATEERGGLRFGAGATYSEYASEEDGVEFTAYLLLKDRESGAEVLRFEIGAGEASLLGVAEKLVNTYEGDPALGTRYAENPLWRAILREYGIEPVPYLPGRTVKERLEYTVSPEGDFADLAAAFAAAGEALSGKTDTAVTLRLGAGVHRVEETLTLSDIPRGCYFTVVGEEGAVVTGAVPLTEVTKEGDLLLANLPREGTYRGIWADGVAATPAHSGYIRYEAAKNDGKEQAISGRMDASRTVIYLDPALFAGLSDTAIGGAEVHIEVEWEFRILRILRADSSDRDAEGRVAVYLDPRDLTAAMMQKLDHGGRHYWLEGKKEFLDEAGEYFLDRERKEVWYLPKEGETPILSVSKTDTLFRFENASGVTLWNFTVTGCDDKALSAHGAYTGGQAGHFDFTMPTSAAVEGKDVSQLCLSEMTFSELWADGAHLWGGIEDVSVLNSRFLGIGASALRFGDADVDFTEAKHIFDVTVRGNEIRDVAKILRTCCAVYFTNGVNLTVADNVISDCSYSAVSVGWRWQSVTFTPGRDYHLYNVLIEGNHISRFMTDTSDGGAIYTLGGNADPAGDFGYFNFIRNNTVTADENTGAGLGRFMVMYHDNASSHWLSTGNRITVASENLGLGAWYIQMGNGALSSPQARNCLVLGNEIVGLAVGRPITLHTGTFTPESEEEILRRAVFYDHLCPKWGILAEENVLLP